MLEAIAIWWRRLTLGKPTDLDAHVGPGTPLHDAALSGDAAAMSQLLEDETLRAAIDMRDARGQAPLHWAILGGYSDVVEVLIEHRADANIPAWDGASPLWTAQDDFGMEAIASMLRAHGGER